MSKEQEAIDKVWKMAFAMNGPGPAEARKIEALIKDACEEARQEGWSDGYFEAGGLGGGS